MRGSTIQERFEDFHNRRPDVFLKLLEYARDIKRSGKKKCGISFIWERARWYWAVERSSYVGTYKLGNEFRSHYARLIMRMYPNEFAGFFELRRLRTK